LKGDFKNAERLLNEIRKEKCERPFEFERLKFVDEMFKWLTSRDIFLNKVQDIINHTRQNKKLPDVIRELKNPLNL